MARTVIVSAAVGALAATSLGATVKLDLSVHANDGYRGAHTATVISGDAGMFGVGGPANSFETFCIEKNEYFVPGATYDAQIDTGARNGGVSGGTGGFDPISPATAYLYTQFRAGNLGFSGVTNAADSAALQDAIWFLEGEITSVSGQAQTLVNDALAAGWTDLGSVRVINLWGPNGGGDGYAQSQLTMVPLPAAAWAGLGVLGGLGLLQAKRRRSMSAE